METTIRVATEADVPALDTHDPMEGVRCVHAEDVSNRNNFYLVAEREGQICAHGYVRWTGFMRPEAAQRHPSSVVVNSLAVWPESVRGQGIGSRLLEALEEQAIERRCERIALGVNLSNVAAIAFYERHGYERWPGEPFDIGSTWSPEGWIAMGKSLGAPRSMNR